MLNFLFPIFFWGLLAIIVPIVLHLLMIKIRSRRYLPSLFLLNEVMLKIRRKNSLLKYIILALRVLIIILLTICFVYPYISKMATQPREVSIVIVDGSFSMGRADIKKNVEKVINAQLALSSYYYPTMVCVAKDSLQWSGEFTHNANSLRQFVYNNINSSESSDLHGAIVASDFKLSNVVRGVKRNVFIITDRQKFPWENLKLPLKLDNIDSLQILPINIDKAENCAIKSAKFLTATESITLEVEVENFNNRATTGYMDIELGDEKFYIDEFNIGPASTIKLQKIIKVKDKTKNSPVILTLHTKCKDVLPIDNRYFLGLNQTNKPTVFVAPFADSQVLKTVLSNSCMAKVTSIEDASMIIFNTAVPEKDEVQRLLDSGKTLIFCASSKNQAMKNRLEDFGFSFLKKSSTMDEAGSVDIENPIYKEILKVPATGYFSAMFFAPCYFRAPEESEILAHFASNNPMISVTRVGKGKIIVLGFRSIPEETNFSSRALFVVFWHELVKYLAGSSHQQKLQFTVGEKGYTQPRVFKNSDGEYVGINLNYNESSVAMLESDFKLTKSVAKRSQITKAQALKKQNNSSNIWRNALIILLIAATVELFLSNRSRI